MSNFMMLVLDRCLKIPVSHGGRSRGEPSVRAGSQADADRDPAQHLVDADDLGEAKGYDCAGSAALDEASGYRITA
jgi:hypothetical protein